MKRMTKHLLILAITITSIVLGPTLKSHAQQSNDNLRTVPSNSGIQHYDPVSGQYYEYINIHRLLNPNLVEHFYTASENEANKLIKAGWVYEGVAWKSTSVSLSEHDEVYRLLNPNDGRHLFTTSEGEKNKLEKKGWIFEKIAFYSCGSIPIYRYYNPNNGDHILTWDPNEQTILDDTGWVSEGKSLNGAWED